MIILTVNLLYFYLNCLYNLYNICQKHLYNLLMETIYLYVHVAIVIYHHFHSWSQKLLEGNMVLHIYSIKCT